MGPIWHLVGPWECTRRWLDSWCSSGLPTDMLVVLTPAPRSARGIWTIITTLRFFDEPGSQIVTKARSTAPANQKPPNGTSSGLPSRTDNNSGISAAGSLAARLANAPRGYGGFRTIQKKPDEAPFCYGAGAGSSLVGTLRDLSLPQSLRDRTFDPPGLSNTYPFFTIEWEWPGEKD
jgi:hypothetical protein